MKRTGLLLVAVGLLVGCEESGREPNDNLPRTAIGPVPPDIKPGGGGGGGGGGAAMPSMQPGNLPSNYPGVIEHRKQNEEAKKKAGAGETDATEAKPEGDAPAAEAPKIDPPAEAAPAPAAESKPAEPQA
jgi:hypothetical protein